MKLVLLTLLSFCSYLSFSQQQTAITVYFEFNETALTEKSVIELEGFSEKLKGKEIVSINIEGHTDLKGSDYYNIKLAAARAQQVSDKLKTFFSTGLSISQQSYGKERPITIEMNKQDRNRRVEVIVFYKDESLTAVPAATELQSFFEDVETQSFQVNLDDTVIVIGKEGTIIKISPGSIQYKSGKLAKGEVEVQLKEYFRPGDILLSGLNSVSDRGLLETGGMFYFRIIKNKDTMSEKSAKPVSIRLPVVNNATERMNVFVKDIKDSLQDSHGADTLANVTNWRNTDSVFTRVESFWAWPVRKDKIFDWKAPYDVKFENWKTGHKISNKEFLRGRSFLGLGRNPKHFTKRYSTETQKIDSVTLTTTIKIRYRNRGAKAFNTRNFDTTFVTKYRRKEYVGFTYKIGWINCDRFWNYPNKTDYYVATPGFYGANVIVYFKSQNAFMPAQPDDKELYKIADVPSGQKVWVVAFGKKGNEYYLGKEETEISRVGKANISLSKISKEDFHKEIKSF